MSETATQHSLRETNKHILIGLSDLLELLESEDVEYRIFGSVLTTAAIGLWFRELGDVEVLLDKNKKEAVLHGLKEKGYQEVKSEEMEKAGHKTLKTAVDGLVIGLQKNKTTLSLHFAQMDANGAILSGKAGFSGRFPSKAIEPSTLSLDEYTFQTLPPEAQYLMLKWKLLVDGVQSQAARDAKLLEPIITKEKVNEIVKQKPGIYWRKTRLPMNLIFRLAGIRNKLKHL